MTIEFLAKKLDLDILTSFENISSKIDGCYIGDLLSWVMANAKEGNIWVTVMGNVNAVAVAVLTDVPCIILAENALLDSDAKERAVQNGIVILQSGKNAYELAVMIHKLFSEEEK